MKIVQLKDSKKFALAGISFTELKTIKDACDLYARQGSRPAEKLAREIEQQMEEVSI